MAEGEGDEGVLKKIGKFFGGDDEEDDDKEKIAGFVLKDVEREIGFKTSDGKIITGLRGLADFLESISKDEFVKYVDSEKNDFAWWVENSVGDKVLGKRLGKINDSLQMANEIKTRVKELEPYVKKEKKGEKSEEEVKDKSEEGEKAEEDDKANAEEEGKGGVGEEEKSEGDGEEEGENKENEKDVLDVGIKGKKAEDGDGEEGKKEPAKKGKSVAELLAEEGVVATEAPEDEGAEEEKPKTINDVLMTIEKINGKIDMFDQFRKSSDVRVGDLAERIGELRQMLLDKERDFNEISSGFERINDAVGDIKPSEISKQLEKMGLELEKRDARIEKTENQAQALMEEVGDYRKRMARIRDFDNLIDSLNKLKEEVTKIEENKRYIERIAAKSEHIFGELNEKVLIFKNQSAKVDKTDAIAQDLMLSVDKLSTDMEKLASKEDLENFKGDIQKEKFGVSKEDFGKSITSLEAEVVKIGERMEKLDFKIKGGGELEEEKRRLRLYIDKLNRDYKDEKLTESAYLELIKSSKARMEEVDGVLKRLDREAMYKDLNKLTKVVNEHAVKFKECVEGKEFDGLLKSVADLRHKLESSKIEDSILNLQDAKTNIFGRLGDVERDIRELDLSVRDLARMKDDIVKFKGQHKDFQDLISGNISEIDAVKGVLSAMENKLEGDLKGRLEKIEFASTERDDVTTSKLKLFRDEIELMVKEKLKSMSLFNEEIKALREGKSLMFDKINSNERGIEEINSLLASLRGEIRVFAPKISSVENSVEGNLTPSVVQLRAKIGELDLLKSDLNVLRLKVNEIVEENLDGKVGEIEREIVDLKKGVYGE